MYVYTAKDQTNGQLVKSEIQAQSEQAAAKTLIQQNMIPISIKAKSKQSKFLGGLRGRVKPKDRVLYTRQLSTLIGAGLPLAQSLRTVGEQTTNETLVAANGQIISDVEGGKSLADAFAKHPKIFNTIYVQLIAAGEVSGTLDKSMERVATQQEKDAEIISKIRGAMIYPLIVVVVIFGVVIFMLTTVVPQIEILYRDLKVDLPFLTKILVGASRILTNFWYLLVPIMVGTIFGIRVYSKTEGGRIAFDKFKMKVPLFGRLFMKLYMARFSRTGSTLMAAGVPLLDMLNITAGAINNYHVAGSIQRASIKVKGGKALSDSLESDPNFLSLVPQMLRIGENSGSIDAMMEKTAIYYEQELDNEIKTISTIIEPVLMIILAIMAAIVIAAILLPVYGLVNQTLT